MPEIEILPPLRPGQPRPPIPGPLLVRESGHALLPSMRERGAFELTRVEQGLALGWKPTPEIGGLLLAISDGRASVPMLATVLTRAALKELIADLQSIDTQLDALGIR